MPTEAEPVLRIEDTDDDEPRLLPCYGCWGEGCGECDGDGVIYP
ncbi:hypothetical protein [Saccharopolyspora sp. 6T]|nr:hypothetical protein [Saccharopolyspora sp. 6T]